MRPSLQLLHQLPPVDVTPPQHAPILGSRSVDWPDEPACADFAAALAQQPELRDAFIELSGGLGAGKTTFARHLLRALGVEGRIKSPTFAVLETYALPQLDISHFDFYRFADAHEWQDAGFRDIFAAPGLKLVEWPEHAHGALPLPDLRLGIEVLDAERRRVELQAFTPRGVVLLA